MWRWFIELGQTCDGFGGQFSLDLTVDSARCEVHAAVIGDVLDGHVVDNLLL